MNQIAQGAEAKLFLEKNKIIKNRFRKTYRIKEIDSKLRKSRTKREAKILEKLENINFPSPKIISNDKKEKIELEYIKGILLKNSLTENNCLKLSKEVGKKIALLHNNHIIHGDLTTSNMILDKEIFFIDFGLSFYSHKIEDKAVDLHLFREALESKHAMFWQKAFNSTITEYLKKAVDGDEIVLRLMMVEKRGRYKGKK